MPFFTVQHKLFILFFSSELDCRLDLLGGRYEPEETLSRLSLPPTGYPVAHVLLTYQFHMVFGQHFTQMIEQNDSTVDGQDGFALIPAIP